VDVSAVIVSWNTCDLLRRCLGSLDAELKSRAAEVIVVDNDSSDGSAELVAREFPQASLVRLSGNQGFGRAANRGALEALGRFLLIANADVAAEPGAIERLLAAAEHHPGCGAFAPRLQLPEGKTQDSVFQFPSVGSALALNLGLRRIVAFTSRGRLILGAGNPETSRTVPWALGACLLIRRQAWEVVGGFDENLWMYAEDLDLGWRLRQAGWSTCYIPDAVFDHFGGAAAQQAWGEERLARGVLSGYAWILKRRGWLSARTIAISYVAGCAIRTAMFGALALFKPVPWTEKRDAMRRSMRLHAQGLRPVRELRDHR
jgi:GT2 family glycosyltransferase